HGSSLPSWPSVQLQAKRLVTDKALVTGKASGYWQMREGKWNITCFILFHCCGPLRSFCLRGLNSSDPKEQWLTDKYEEETEQTFELKFHKYNRWVRPPQRYVNVTVEMEVQRIKFLDVLRQELQTVIGMEMTWFDSRLSWTPIRVHQIMTNTSSVWTPDLLFLNSVSPTQSLLPGIVRIKKDGIIAWTRKEVVTTSCETSLNAETQTCPLKLGFMSNIKEKQNDRFIDQDKSFVLTSDDLRSHEWDLHSISLDFDTENDTSLPLEMDIDMTVNRLNVEGGNSGNPSYSTVQGCSANCRNAAPYRHRLFGQEQYGAGLLFLLISLLLIHS
ncbi:hypothetical protein RRG08_065666, partial [Elysia crispata]